MDEKILGTIEVPIINTKSLVEIYQPAVSAGQQIRSFDLRAIHNIYTTNTYTELLYLIANNLLISGYKYLLSDFRTVHYFSNSISGTDINTGVLEPLLLTAKSTNSFERIAVSTLFPDELIEYLINVSQITPATDTSFYKLGIIVPGFKGFINRRVDYNYNIDCAFDWRNIKTRLYKFDVPSLANNLSVNNVKWDILTNVAQTKTYVCLASSNGDNITTSSDWMEIGSSFNINDEPISPFNTEYVIYDLNTNPICTIPVDNTKYSDYLTFNSGTSNVELGKSIVLLGTPLNTILPSIVFKYTVSNFYAKGTLFFGNTFISTVDNINFTGQPYVIANLFINAISNMDVNSGLAFNILGLVSDNILTGLLHGNIINTLTSNTLSTGEGNIANLVASNTIKNNFNLNINRGDCIGNNIGISCINNIWTDDCISNNIDDNFSGNTFTKELVNNTIDIDVEDNTCNDIIIGNSIGCNFKQNVINNSISNCIIEDFISGNEFSIDINTTNIKIYSLINKVIAPGSSTLSELLMNKTIYLDKTHGSKLSYMDSNVLTIIDIND